MNDITDSWHKAFWTLKTLLPQLSDKDLQNLTWQIFDNRFTESDVLLTIQNLNHVKDKKTSD